MPVGEAPPIEDTNVIDLMAALRASLTRGAAPAQVKAPPSKPMIAKKAAAKAPEAGPAKKPRKAG